MWKVQRQGTVMAVDSVGHTPVKGALRPQTALVSRKRMLELEAAQTIGLRIWGVRQKSKVPDETRMGWAQTLMRTVGRLLLRNPREVV